MVRALFPTLAVVAALATTAQAQSYEILRSDCNGQVSFMVRYYQCIGIITYAHVRRCAHVLTAPPS